MQYLDEATQAIARLTGCTRAEARAIAVDLDDDRREAVHELLERARGECLRYLGLPPVVAAEAATG